MIPLTLKMRNFLSYRGDTPVFDFRVLHIACISGDNGAGKSSFLEAIHWALWGKARVDDNSELISRGEASMLVELVFEVNQLVYRVTRTFSTERRSGSKLDLAQAIQYDQNTWTSLNGSSIGETQLKITRDIVGMSFDIFQNSAYLRQGKADAFVQLTSSERREVIAEILEITKYDTYQQEAKRRRDSFGAVIETLRGKINDDERTALELPSHIELLRAHEDKLTNAQAYKTYADAVEAQHTIHQQCVTLDHQQQERQQRLTTQQTELQQYTEKLAHRPTIEATYAQYQQQLAYVQLLEQRQKQVEPLVAQRQTARERLRDAQNAADVELAQLTAKIELFAQLPQQQREIEAELADIIRTLDASADASGALDDGLKRRETLQHQLNTLQLTQQEMTRNATELLRIQQRIDELRVVLAQYPDAVAQLEVANSAQIRLQELETIISEVRAQDTSLDKELATLKQNADKLKARRDAIHAGEPCPTCQTVMDEAHLSHAYTTFDQQLDDWRTLYRNLQTQQKDVRLHKSTAEHEKSALHDVVSQLRSHQQRVARFEAQKQQLVDAEAEAAQLIATLSQNDAQQITQRIQSIRNDISSCESHINTLREQQTIRQTLHKRVDDLTKQRDRLVAQIHQRDAAIAQHDQLRADMAAHRVGQTYIQQIVEIDAQIAAIDFDEATLHAARQTLVAFGDIQTEFKLLESIESTSAVIARNIADIHRDLTQTSEQLQHLHKENQRIQRHIESLAPHFSESDRALPVRQMQQRADANIHTLSDMVGRMRERVFLAEQAQLRLEEHRIRLHAEEQQRQRFEILTNAFSNRGIQAMLINDYALPALEQEANRLLARMTDNQLYLSFKTNHLTKQGKTQEVLEIEVSDSAGTRPLEAFSGGESFRISFALRIALSKLLAHRAGHRLETLIIDEGFGTQDAQGRERLVEAINSISDEFRTILVITHVSEVRDMFPTQIIIRRTSQSSMWEIMS